MTTPIIEKLNDASGDDTFEERDDDFLEGIAEDAGVDKPAGKPASTQASPIPGGGYVLEEPSASKLFKKIDREVRDQERLARNRDQAGKHWDRVRRGVPFSYLEKNEDQSIWEAKLAPGVEDTQQPIPNKVLDLSNKQVSQILVDPPIPSPKSDGDAERSRSAMDLAGRFLRADGAVTGTNDSELYREVLTMNRTRSSAFVYVWVDPTGGGWRPKQKMAHPQAQDPRNPLMGPKIDEATGQPVLDEMQQPILERTSDPILRYVGEVEDDGEDAEEGAMKEVFVEHAAEAAREWLPKERRMVIHPNQVRTFPRTATAFDAQKITILMWEPLSEARKRFDCLAGMSKAELKQLTNWKPKRWKSIVPESQRPKSDGLDGDGEVTDETLLFWYLHFCRISPEYPDGAELAINGANLSGNQNAGFVFLRDTLREDVETDTGEIVPVLMDPPIAQFRSLIDTECGDPFGMAPVSLYGGANEIRAHLYLSALEDIDVKLHPNTYLTSDSSITKEDMNRRDGTPLEVLTKDHMPTFEQRPELPSHLPEMLERVEHEMDTAANLNQTAQALDSTYSQSGEAKKVALRQAKVQLAQDWQGFINGFLQYMKIKLQLAQAKLKVPMLVKASGSQESSYKARYFVGSDMLGVSAATLMPGSGTMMSPAEKMQYLATGQGEGWVQKEEAAEIFRSSMSDDLGLPPSPHEEHIDRDIAEWCEGPPASWEQEYQQAQQFPQLAQQYQAKMQQLVQQLQQTGVDPQTATLQAQQQAGPAPVQPKPLSTPFEPRANDEEPVVAKIHYAKLSRLLSTTEYSRQPKSWRTLVDKRYEQAAFAAGIVTVRQQQQAQAQAAQAEAKKNQPAKDPNAPPFYSEFIAAATKAVVAKAQNLLARETAGLAEESAIATKPAAEHVPAELPDADSTPLELAHQSMEAERDRQHDINMATLNHSNAMEQTLAKAERQATRESGQPMPERPAEPV